MIKINIIQTKPIMTSWTYSYQTSSALTPEQLWPVLSNIAAWPEADKNIESIEVESEPKTGSRFWLKPKKGPKLEFTICEFKPPLCYSDICSMPFAKMKTTHSFERGTETQIHVRIEIQGPLAYLWGVTVGRKHAKGLPALTQRMIDFAGEKNT